MTDKINTGSMFDYLNQAVTNPFSLSENNPAKDIGLDNNESRWGWWPTPSWEAICKKLEQFNDQNFETYIFSGMGGSINTIKAVDKLSQNINIKILCIDSLDPLALKEVCNQVRDWKKTKVIGISKSGGTKETLNILETFKEIYINLGIDYKSNFNWMIDLPNKSKVESKGWEGVDYSPIQVDEKTDIGGRFTAPHTMIFLLPLYLSLGRDLDKLKKIWEEYGSKQKDNTLEAIRQAKELAESDCHLFAVNSTEKISRALETWLIQLFQESLGSKLEEFNPKTVVCSFEEKPIHFGEIKFNTESENEIVKAMLTMNGSQVFIAAFCAYIQALKGKVITFGNQPEVEKYKSAMREVENTEVPEALGVNIDELKARIKKELESDENKKFIEVVAYWHLSDEERKKLTDEIKSNNEYKMVLVFTGSDWNHHSYQAASKNEDTLFVILQKTASDIEIEGINKSTLDRNKSDLERIAYATYSTIKEKSLYLKLRY